MLEIDDTSEKKEAVSGIILATIGSVKADGVTLIFDGQTEASEKTYKCNTSVRFHSGDRVRIVEDSGTYIVEYIVGSPGADIPISLPSGGAAGQVLKKSSKYDYDVEWADDNLPDGGSTGQVLKKKSAANGDVKWADDEKGSGLPAGGTAGQVLVRTTSAAAGWKTPIVDMSQSTRLKFFSGYQSGDVQKTVNQIYSPATATTQQVAMAFNELLAALKAYNLLR